MQLKGKVINVSDVQVITDKFKKCEVWIETQEQYPQVINVQFAQDKADAAQSINVGSDITIDINIRGRKYTNKQGVEGVFNSIEAWRYEVEGATTPAEENDGMPF